MEKELQQIEISIQVLAPYANQGKVYYAIVDAGKVVDEATEMWKFPKSQPRALKRLRGLIKRLKNLEGFYTTTKA